MGTATSIAGSCVLAIAAVIFKLAQKKCERRHNDALDSVQQASISLAECVKKNGGLKCRRSR